MSERTNREAPMFTLLRHAPVPALGLDYFEYRHEPTGARHLHLRRPGELHAFDLSFRTLPEDDSGVAHILEHCSLQGSRRFPVPGMFHKRSRGSFSVFSNAMTGRDLTSYLFHTPLLKDFDQLLAMYVDACFFPLLAEETFRQEGHRLEPADHADPASPLVFTGVVYNEMKANYANPVMRALRGVMDGLCPDTVYARDAGGRPAAIPALSHEAFLVFHRRFYCAANACFSYCGPLTPGELQERLAALALDELAAAPGQAAPLPASAAAPAAPRRLERAFPYRGADPERQGIGLWAWQTGRGASLEDELTVRALLEWLVGSSEAPLLRHILQGGLGAPVAGGVPFMADHGVMLGAQGMALERMETQLDGLRDELERLAGTPVEPALLKAIVDQQRLELRRTEDEDPGDGAFPMQLVARLRESHKIGADPLARLNPAEALEEMAPRLEDEAWLRGQLRARLLENPHALRLTLRPDAELGEAEARAEAEQAARAAAGLDEAARARLAEEGRRLAAHREDTSRDHLIPTLHLADVGSAPAPDPLRAVPAPGLLLQVSAQPTNGLVHLDLEVALSADEPTEVEAAGWLGYLTRFGYGGLAPAEADLRRRALGAELDVDHVLAVRDDDPGRACAALVLGGHCMRERVTDYAAMMRQTLCEPQLEDETRWRELLESRVRSWRLQATGYSVYSYLFLALAGRQSAGARLVDEAKGFPAIGRLRDTLRGDGLPGLLERVRARQRTAAAAARRALAVAEAAELDGLAAPLAREWGGGGAEAPAGRPAAPQGAEPILWLMDTTVSYVGLSWRGLPRHHEDEPLLRVATALLESRCLHPRIREQGGAYGAMAHSRSGAVILSSYRDPRLGASLADLRGALDWLATAEISPRHVEEAALGVLKGLIKAQTPVARLRERRARERQGTDEALLARQVARLRRVEPDELREAARRHLDPASERVVVVSSREIAAREGLTGWREAEI